jgi:hypothetical protein
LLRSREHLCVPERTEYRFTFWCSGKNVRIRQPRQDMVGFGETVKMTCNGQFRPCCRQTPVGGGLSRRRDDRAGRKATLAARATGARDSASPAVCRGSTSRDVHVRAMPPRCRWQLPELDRRRHSLAPRAATAGTGLQRRVFPEFAVRVR